MSENRIWKQIDIKKSWINADTSLLDDIAPSWFARRETLISNSSDFKDFLNRLKRRHAIETGVVERMYDIEKGVTETLINEGFVSSLISHGATNIEKHKLLNHLQDHLDAIDFVFDMVKDERPLTKSFICQLHQLTTRNQEFTEGKTQFGQKVNILLIKGKFKERENNPTREDGTVVLYCPPEHVESEMDALILHYNRMIDKNIHPLIISAWVHHAFTTIHPFQDGNGRVARLIASLIFIKFNYFPITVLREEAKVKYIEALEEADNGKPQRLVTYFAEIQRRNIEEALNIKEVSPSSLESVTNIFKEKIEAKKKEQKAQHERVLAERRLQIFNLCNRFLNEHKDKLTRQFRDQVKVFIDSGRPDNQEKQKYYYDQIVSYAKKHQYYFNRHLPKSYFIFGIDLLDDKRYELGITIHHYGYDDGTIAIGGFLEYKGAIADDNASNMIALDIRPYTLSIQQDSIESKETNIKNHLENILTVAIAQIASEI